MRQDALAMTPAEAEGWAKIGGTVLAVVGGATALALKLARSWHRHRNRRRLEAKVPRYVLDAVHQLLRAQVPNTDWRPSPRDLERQSILIDGLRDELYVADGHVLPRAEDEKESVARIVHAITRTQAIKAKLKQDMFPEDEQR